MLIRCSQRCGYVFWEVLLLGQVLLGGPVIAVSQDDVSAEVPAAQSANVSAGRQRRMIVQLLCVRRG